jgi:hypothetical protein
MILVPSAINNRDVFYLQLKNNLAELKTAELSNWVVFVIADDINLHFLDAFADLCIEKDVLYVCAVGQACSQVDDLFDMNMVMRDIEERPKPSWFRSDEDVLMTTWHHKFEEGFWFCTTQTTYEVHLIDTVLVANLTEKDYLPKVIELTKLISEGWLPPD